MNGNANKLFELLLKLLLVFEFYFLEYNVTLSLDHIGFLDFYGLHIYSLKFGGRPVKGLK